jgi:hypothetical protein
VRTEVQEFQELQEQWTGLVIGWGDKEYRPVQIIFTDDVEGDDIKMGLREIGC